VAAQFIIAGDPAMRHLITPRVEHFQALLMPGLIPNLLWHVAFLASVLISYPFLRQGQAEVEQRMLLTTDVAHE